VRLNQGRFDAETTYAEDPLVVAQRWQDAGAQWLHIVDLDGAKEGKPSAINRAVLERIRKAVPLPIQFGGGVRSVETVRELQELGVARVVLGTTAAKSAELAETIFTEFGELVAVGVDARNGIVAVQGWQEESGEQATDFVVRMANLGAKRFIFTDIARDGMLQGINKVALEGIAQAVPHLPVVASGGVTNIQDIVDLLTLKRSTIPLLDGVIIGKALYTGNVDLKSVLELVSQA
jgi:phosphoribosylformimino-5-aminoimidazole carboxamide ribotide isomerase